MEKTVEMLDGADCEIIGEGKETEFGEPPLLGVEDTIERNPVDSVEVDVGDTQDIRMHTPNYTKCSFKLESEKCNNNSQISIKHDMPILDNSSVEDTVEEMSGSLLGMTGKTVEEMYDLYCRHSKAIGFSVRKLTTRQSTKEGVIEKYFVCSSSGLRKSRTLMRPKKTVPNTRTGCHASLRIKRNEEGLYEVVHHVTSHNHTLSRKEWTHFHRSERQITNDKGKAIEDMISSGMGAMDSYRYMAHVAGGNECVGHTAKDHLNFVNRLRMNAVEDGDAQTLVDMLRAKSEKEPDFFFRVKFDDQKRLCSVFWRDSMMIEDYALYGDVVVFDTTYRTNKYNLICAPFVGVNNHRKNIMFACAFLANETMESFVWLFDVFRKSMRGMCPITLFTDQDPAISGAIKKAFPATRHRLCLWHIHQNAVSHFGAHKRDKTFKKTFHKCLSGCDTEMEFEECWKSMLTTYKLEDHHWFKSLYKKRNKWCPALSKDFFSAGMLSSQRSESTNSAIGFKAKKTTSLTQFYDIFADTVTRWRDNEKNDEYQCSSKIPISTIPLNGLLRHASKVYTLTLFKEFEAEFVKCVHSRSTLIHMENNVMLYDISFVRDSIEHRVTYDFLNKIITCSCKKFESVGILCYHCLRVLNVNSVFEIPDRYILKRWTKIAKCELWDRMSGVNDGLVCISKDGVLWRHEMARRYYNRLLQCQDNVEARKFIEESDSRDSVAINVLLTSSATTTQVENPATTNIVLNPEHVVTKGRSKRITCHFPKGKKKKRGETSSGAPTKKLGPSKKKKQSEATSSGPTTEFGSSTPIAQ